MATKTKKSAPKKWSPPKGWTVERQENVLQRGSDERTDLLTGTKEYDDGVTREIVAHSEDEFDTIAAANDADVERRSQQP